MESKKILCLIVDDEPIARKIIRGYIDQIPSIECVAECKNAIEALDLLNKNNAISIIFLDINMPNISGISMVKIMLRQPQIIFTTAYSQFAVESYELNAVDYLLKPFMFDRFAKAVFKAMERLKNNPSILLKADNFMSDSPFFIKSGGQNFPVNITDIMYCEAMKNYTKVFMLDNTIYYPLIPLSKFELEISSQHAEFIRIHRSFLISKAHLLSVGADFVMIGKYKIPIGNQYREEFRERIGMG